MEVILQNYNILIIDFLFTLIENFFLIKFLEIFFHKTKNISLLFSILLTLISYLFYYTVPFDFQVFGTFIVPLFLLIYCKINLPDKFTKQLLFSVLTYINLFLVDMSIYIISFFIDINILTSLVAYSFDYILIITFQRLSLIVEYFFVKYFYQTKPLYSNKTSNLIILLLIMVIIYPEVFLTKYISKSPLDFFSFTISILLFIIILFLIMLIYKNIQIDNKKIIEQEILIDTIKHEERVLKLIEDKTTEMNRIIHDLKAHKSVYHYLEENSKENEANDYLEQLKNSIMYVYTSNDVLNFILNEKAKLAKSFDIDIKYILQGDFSTSIENIDLSILIGNLLDNAIEAAKESTPKFIHVKMTQDNHKLLIDIENSFNKINVKNNSFISTKNNNKKHGFGMSNIKLIVEKYHGNEYINYDDSIFKHVCILPLKQ